VLAPRKGPQPTRKSHSVIDELLKIVADGNMFTYEETEQMKTGMHEWYEGMPDLGRTLVEHEEMALVEHEHGETEVVEGEKVAERLPRHTLRRTMHAWTFR
jgi:hypothetical protein